MFWDSTLLLLLPVFAFALWAQNRVRATYREYLEVPGARGLTGAEAARRLLDAAGLSSVGIETVDGELSDHYDPRGRVLRLSDGNHRGRSLAALGVSCHEAGHAIQHARGYAPLQWRQAVWPVAGFGSRAALPLFFLGFIFQYPLLMDLGILVYMVAAAFALITLPVEFDASRRAVTLLSGQGIIARDEESGVRKVLNAAALTYVAAALMAIVQLLRLFILRGRR